MDPFDKSLCSFPVPEFASEADEDRWVASLTPAQRLELLELVRLWRWGKDALGGPIDRSSVQVMTMEEFRAAKEEEAAAEEVWRAAHGLPPQFSRAKMPQD